MYELHRIRYNEEFLIFIDPLSKTDDVAVSSEVEEETEYGFRFPGCKIFNKDVSLLTRKSCDSTGN